MCQPSRFTKYLLFPAVGLTGRIISEDVTNLALTLPFPLILALQLNDKRTEGTTCSFLLWLNNNREEDGINVLMDFHPGITAWSSELSCVLTSPLTVNQSRRFFLVLIWLLKGGGEASRLRRSSLFRCCWFMSSIWKCTLEQGNMTNNTYHDNDKFAITI